MKIYCSETHSPFGPVYIFASDVGVLKVVWRKKNEATDETLINFPGFELEAEKENEISRLAARQLEEYFRRELTAFKIPLHLIGTGFQVKVWETLQKIPFGEVWSYEKLAREVGNPGAVRAVGNANAKNPIPIIIPCHRVIRKNGELGGYRGGIEIKRWLLEYEGIIGLRDKVNRQQFGKNS